MVDRKVIEIIKQYLRELEEQGVHISRAYLYGSQARGTAGPESDIDVMLVSPIFDGDYKPFLRAIWWSQFRSENRIEPFIVGEKRFETDDMSPIIGIVKEEGIEIAA